MWKRFALAAVAAFALLSGPARADMPQTDVDLVKQMTGQPADKIVEALDIYYRLHVSELMVQNIAEDNVANFFATRRANEASVDAGAIAKLEAEGKSISAKRKALTEENRNLRVKLEEVSGIEFLDALIMTPDAPMAKPAAASGDLAAQQERAWKALEAAQTRWREQRMALLEAQQRYDDTRDVHLELVLNDMTRAEIALAEAVGACRLVEAKIAASQGKPISDVLAAL